MLARFWKRPFWKNAAVLGFVTLLVVETIARIIASSATSTV